MPFPTQRLLALLFACAGLLAGAIALPAGAPAASSLQVTPGGVGSVRLGSPYAALLSGRHVETMTHGCEVAGPQTRSARLRGPLKGSVDLTANSPRHVAIITVTGGATAHGIGVGATLASAQAAFKGAKLDTRTSETFGVVLLTVPKGAGGPMQLAVDAATKRVTMIAVPHVALCD